MFFEINRMMSFCNLFMERPTLVSCWTWYMLWHCWLGHLTCKIVPEMTYDVSSWTLNPSILLLLLVRVLWDSVFGRHWNECWGGVTGSLLLVVVSFSLGSVFEAIECIQVYYTALYRPHGSTDITSKTMHKITLCIICNALYTTGQSAVAHWTLRFQRLSFTHDAALHVSCQSFSLPRPITSLTTTQQQSRVCAMCEPTCSTLPQCEEENL